MKGKPVVSDGLRSPVSPAPCPPLSLAGPRVYGTFLVSVPAEAGAAPSSLVVEPLRLAGGDASANRPCDNLVKSLDLHL